MKNKINEIGKSKINFTFFQPNILADEWNDEVFKNKNRIYGAYQLRHHYSEHLLKAFFLSVSTVILFFIFNILINNKNQIAINEIIPDVFIRPEIFDFPPVENNKPLPQLNSKPVINAPTIISKDSILKTQSEIKLPSVPISKGTGTDTSGSILKNGGHQSGGSVKNGTGEVKKDSIVTWAPEMPEFPGGLDALNKFISKRLKTNNQWRESGTDGKVVYEFVVGRDGKITDIKIIRDGVSYGIAELNLSIFDNMPEWKPGKNNGNAVKVLYRLPIKFVKE